jgi:hypothetical protein
MIKYKLLANSTDLFNIIRGRKGLSREQVQNKSNFNHTRNIIRAKFSKLKKNDGLTDRNNGKVSSQSK